jgi:hypothetical protein
MGSTGTRGEHGKPSAQSGRGQTPVRPGSSQEVGASGAAYACGRCVGTIERSLLVLRSSRGVHRTDQLPAPAAGRAREGNASDKWPIRVWWKAMPPRRRVPQVVRSGEAAMQVEGGVDEQDA